jgi:hypothetical protein
MANVKQRLWDARMSLADAVKRQLRFHCLRSITGSLQRAELFVIRRVAPTTVSRLRTGPARKRLNETAEAVGYTLREIGGEAGYVSHPTLDYGRSPLG